jgi:uncharacterized SAM-binding protein YcdF (DUF218 family)
MGPRLYEGMSLREISEYLFLSDEPEPCDLILVFGGKRKERADKAVELFKAGYAPRLLFSGGDKLESGMTEAAMLKEAAAALGVPEEACLLEAQSTNTLENVKMCVPLVEAEIGWRQMRGVILVSAPHHMRRAKQVLAKYIPREVKIYCVPDDRYDIRADNWWHTQEGQNLIYRELEKVRRYALQGEV